MSFKTVIIINEPEKEELGKVCADVAAKDTTFGYYFLQDDEAKKLALIIESAEAKQGGSRGQFFKKVIKQKFKRKSGYQVIEE
jgi:hypothetical protein